jgi:transcriptional regulator GlxA family with amidase domain
MPLPESVALPEVQVARPGDQRLLVATCVIESTVRRSEVGEYFLGQFSGGHEPARFEGVLVRLQQAIDEAAAVLQVAAELDLTRSFARSFQDTLRMSFPSTKQSTVVLSELVQD